MRKLDLKTVKLEDGTQIGYLQKSNKEKKNPKVLEQRQYSRVEENGFKKYRLN